MTFDGHLAPVRGLPDVGLHRNNLLSRLSLGHRTHLLFALVASAFTATEQKLGRPGPFKNCNPLCLFVYFSRTSAHAQMTRLLHHSAEPADTAINTERIEVIPLYINIRTFFVFRAKPPTIGDFGKALDHQGIT